MYTVPEVSNYITPWRTAIRRTTFSRPMRWVIQRYLIGNTLSRVKTLLDYGCGRGDDVFALYRMNNITPVGYDPYYIPTERWTPLIYRGTDEPVGPYDMVTCFYVLCAIADKDERFKVIRKVLRRTTHFSVFAVRTDKLTHVNAQPFNDGVITSRQTFQRSFGHLELEQMVREVVNTIPKEYRFESHKIPGGEIVVVTHA